MGGSVKKLIVGIALAAAAVAVAISGTNGGKDRPRIVVDESLPVATFAGGCFWCVESGFEHVPGVVEAVSGYTGGRADNPTYSQVSSGATGHIESVRVHYDPTVITYEGLLAAFWRMIDPTDADGQFVDRGGQYTTAVFYHDEQQRLTAEKSRDALAATGRYAQPVLTPIREAGEFYAAEEYHQDYYKENPVRYNLYRYGSGRDQYLDRIWGEEIHVDYDRYAPEKG
jgi:peptide methionine sulfoxide reductase msrA/msrB